MKPSHLMAITLLFSIPAWAQAPATAAPEGPRTLEEAAALRARAEQMREDAGKTFAAEQTACYQKFLASKCLDEAKKRRTQAEIEARKIDNQGRIFQREAKRAEVEANDAKRAAEAAEQERQAADGRRKAAEEQAERAARDAQRQKRDAERAAKKARENAQREAKAAARAAPAPE